MLMHRLQDLSDFNSIKVRLEPKYGADEEGWRMLFQFHKGTIRTDNSPHTKTLYREFQFHKGTIRTRRRRCAPMLEMNFNSIKVRLELEALVSAATSIVFQFHKGTIRTASQIAAATRDADFNSIKVRLEPKFDGHIYVDNEFQFHKGTIRTLMLLLFILLKIYFNSIKVRLEL